MHFWELYGLYLLLTTYMKMQKPWHWPQREAEMKMERETLRSGKRLVPGPVPAQRGLFAHVL